MHPTHDVSYTPMSMSPSIAIRVKHEEKTTFTIYNVHHENFTDT